MAAYLSLVGHAAARGAARSHGASLRINDSEPALSHKRMPCVITTATRSRGGGGGGGGGLFGCADPAQEK